ncbi:MAG: Mrp/NBP35 family ATP-binding protein [Desulfobacterales bacterium]|jgi:Mrp family chromosome partitioning ATPase|nr:Mrp/NBP35 family ATP-binding protein [Desulfobacterales bacterium]
MEKCSSDCNCSSDSKSACDCGGDAHSASACNCGSEKKVSPEDELKSAIANSLNNIKNKIIIMSGKGGVGKTSVSVNLALALAKKGYQVGIMDVDLHGPDVPRMLGLTGMLELDSNRKLEPMKYSDNLKVVSIESLMQGRDDAVIWRGPMKYSAIQQFIGEVAWGPLDFLVIDCPPGTGDEPLTIAQTVSDAKAVIVTTPQEVSLADVRKSINFCKTVNMKIFGLIENMSGFACPHCSEVIDMFGSGGGERTAAAMGIPFLGKIPFDNNMVRCGDAGCAFHEQFENAPATRVFADIADKLGAAL